MAHVGCSGYAAIESDTTAQKLLVQRLTRTVNTPKLHHYPHKEGFQHASIIHSLRICLCILTVNMILQRGPMPANGLHVHIHERPSYENDYVPEPSQRSKIIKQRPALLQQICSNQPLWAIHCASPQFSSLSRFQAIRELKHILTEEFNNLRNNTEIKRIDRDKAALYTKQYRFLPRIKSNSKVQLHKWHRQMQIYVGAFDFLYRAQLYYDFKKYSRELNVARELKTFRDTALYLLCTIKDKISETSPKYAVHVIKPHSMTRSLNFTTEALDFPSESCTEKVEHANNVKDVNEFDLRFTKARFLSFLRNMRKVIRYRIANRSSISESSRSSGTHESSNTEGSDSTDRHLDSSLSSDSSAVSKRRERKRNWDHHHNNSKLGGGRKH